ncbi:preprotein translocase subunit SecE [Alloalcanivorax gelatiniphagus]|uniref:Protein translocase subunit SecE n=1 Tax=Alloalcanivorax gelatiniphagus TaxID=1194167 RepID=A0ABY2XRZ4_9GAMM|nr:preprotein translocase subunit SecE [Alloalcanivorax gelatiniphagus]TMW15045.1 preprotein translocase subunit SecE [Alloalcanivorax gelatiniphagus]|tara:strand:- start:2094 stop:2468 length:375 start_codon:yes stop_codon:yes gene_type:complete
MSERAEGQSGSSVLEALKWVIVAVLVATAVAGNSYFSEFSPLYRALGVLVVGLLAAFVALQTEQGRAFNQLRKDSMVELRKVVWPTRQETLQTTLIVLVFVLIVALLMFMLDWVLNGAISALIG